MTHINVLELALRDPSRLAADLRAHRHHAVDHSVNLPDRRAFVPRTPRTPRVRSLGTTLRAAFS